MTHSNNDSQSTQQKNTCQCWRVCCCNGENGASHLLPLDLLSSESSYPLPGTEAWLLCRCMGSVQSMVWWHCNQCALLIDSHSTSTKCLMQEKRSWASVHLLEPFLTPLWPLGTTLCDQTPLQCELSKPPALPLASCQVPYNHVSWVELDQSTCPLVPHTSWVSFHLGPRFFPTMFLFGASLFSGWLHHKAQWFQRDIFAQFAAWQDFPCQKIQCAMLGWTRAFSSMFFLCGLPCAAPANVVPRGADRGNLCHWPLSLRVLSFSSNVSPALELRCGTGNWNHVC